jgi:hypothetical protein
VTSIALFIPIIWLGWVQGILWLGLAIGCLCNMRAYAPGNSSGSAQLRLLSCIGFIVTAVAIVFWLSTILQVVAILLVPAALFFVILIFRPTLARESRGLRIYLTACIASSVLIWPMSYVSMLMTR